MWSYPRLEDIETRCVIREGEGGVGPTEGVKNPARHTLGIKIGSAERQNLEETLTSHVIGSVTSWMAVMRRQQASIRPIVTL